MWWSIKGFEKRIEKSWIMCEFCDNIKDVERYKKIEPLNRVDCIVEYKNCYCYWHECEDWYYSGILFEINYCPKCGRKLK